MERFWEFGECLEYCLVPQYEEQFDWFRSHASQLENAIVNFVELGNRAVLVQIQFPKPEFTVSKA